jgi:hypothetical protein
MLSSRECDALRKLLAVAQQGAQAAENWPCNDVDTDDRDWLWPLEVSYEHLVEGLYKIEAAIAALCGTVTDEV